MKVIRGSIIGFCFGVSNTVDIATKCLNKAKERNLPCYSIGALIHNKDVVDDFREKGLFVIKSPQDVPNNSSNKFSNKCSNKGLVLIRAHGITDKLRRAFNDAEFELVDSTCPIVLKGINALREAAKTNRKLVVLGFENHAETIALLGVEDERGESLKITLLSSVKDSENFILKEDSKTPIYVVTQTTFPQDLYKEVVSSLRSHFNDVSLGNAPCPACHKRIENAVETASKCDCAIVVGCVESANTKNLAHEVQKIGKTVFLVENAKALDDTMIEKIASFATVALLSGASTPMWVIDEVEKRLKEI